MDKKKGKKKSTKKETSAKQPSESRKWLITINNPIEHGFDRERVKNELGKIIPIVYWCTMDEISESGTHHSHIYIACSSGVRFTTLKNRFPTARLDAANGSSRQNRDYITKTGRWIDTKKAETSVDGSFEEWGELPIESEISFRGGLEAAILKRIKQGVSNASLLLEFPDALRLIHTIEYVRQTLIAEENRNKWRDLQVEYLFGPTGAGKTRSVMEGHGYANVYAVNDYKHPFDGYKGEGVLLFDEFDSGIKLHFMNNYLDGYPISLPARYSNKQACYERVYIISNLDLIYQYRHEQTHQPEVWSALLRRIHKVVRFMPDGTRREYATADYISGAANWAQLPPETPTPFETGVVSS